MSRLNYNQPNTRARIDARRRARRLSTRASVTPGPRRAFGAWLATGRLAGLLMMVVALVGIGYVFTTPRFTVRDIQVEGIQVMRSSEIVERAGVLGHSIWFVDTTDVVRRLKDSAYIEQAQAYLSLPDHLTLVISERRPEVRWRAGGALYLVDASGRVLDADTSTPITPTLVIEDNSNRHLSPNDRVDPDALKLGQVLALRLPNELGLSPSSIGWDIAAGVFVRTADARTIVFGQTEHLDDKLAILRMVLKDGTVFSYLDLRSSTPFYRSDPTMTSAPMGTPTPAQ